MTAVPVASHYAFQLVALVIATITAGGALDLVRRAVAARSVERQRADENLRATQARLQQVIGSSAAVIYVLRVEGSTYRPTWISENILQVMGYGVEEALASGWWIKQVHPEDLEGVLADQPLLEQKGQLTHEYRFRHQDGSYRWILDKCRLLPNADENRTDIVGSWLDITERKLLEARFHQAQKMEAIGELAGGVAHDFNNLLTAVISYSDLLLAELAAGDPHRDDVAEIKRAGERGRALTQQLLAYSRRQVLQPRVLDVNAVVTNLEAMLRRLIPADVELTSRLPRQLGRVKADAGQLEQVIVNLVVNARDALPHGGRVHIETTNLELDHAYAQQHPPTVPGRYVMLAISDTGIGMDEHTKARLFEPFFTTKEAGKGTGLGLATVYGIVKQSGGYIWVYSELGRGTTFKIYLPRVDEAADSLDTTVCGERDLSGRETVLLVDDDATVRQAARRILARSGYTVLEAGTGREALQMSGQYSGPIHLLLTDVVMPEQSGRELMEHLKGSRPRTACLLMSGYTGDTITRDDMLEAGAGFLEKPFTAGALLGAVREVLDEEA